MLTIIITNKDDKIDLTLESIKKNDSLSMEKVKIYVLESEDYAEAISKADTIFTMIVKSGDEFNRGFLKEILSELELYAYDSDGLENIDVFRVPQSHNGVSLEAELSNVKLRVYDLLKTPQKALLRGDIWIMRTKCLKGHKGEYSRDAINRYLYDALVENPILGEFSGKNGFVFTRSYPISDLDKCKLPQDKGWYLDDINNNLIPLCEMSIQKAGGVLEFLQIACLYELKWKFMHNHNHKNKHLCDYKVNELQKSCHQLLQYIDTKIIINLKQYSSISMTKKLTEVFLLLKLQTLFSLDYILCGKNEILAVVDSQEMFKVSAQKIVIDILEIESNELLIEGYVDSIMPASDYKLLAECNGKAIDLEDTYRYSHLKYFGVSVSKNHTFRCRVSLSDLETCKKIKFYYEIKGRKVPISLVTKRYTSRVTSKLKYSYYVYKDKMIFLSDKKHAIQIRKVRTRDILKREIRLIQEEMFGKNKWRRMALIRILYWLTKPMFKGKRVWITYDKLYKGGDCGEYLFKYIYHNSKEITPAYVINRDCDDRKRLLAQGYPVLEQGTIKQRLYYLNAEVVLATHSGTHSFNAFSGAQVPYIQDLIKSDNVCIQHGLTVQQLAHEQNRVFNNTKRYYCASKYEINNLSHPIYGYEDKEALRLTGIPRFDGLKNNDKKIILITPTWRSYIAMAPVLGKSRPYNPFFKETSYFKIYDELLSNQDLINKVNQRGYKIVYLLHPIISSQIDDYPEHPGIEILQASTIDYEKILTEASLMVTDYSGIQFDFAYMRKPVVYFHPKELPPHYNEGGFFYDTMGFGEICTNVNELVELLCNYLDTDCKLKALYEERENDFFAYNDNDSCKRIYEDLLEYKNNRMAKEEIQFNI